MALAGLSRGIVRFYFDSKAALLIASLQCLADELEERLLEPVRQLRDDPARALEELVKLYLGAEIADPVKVSVWYAFWGEATGRREYLEICGRKDEEFTRLVRDLTGRLIESIDAPHLDPDAIALGLTGALEIIWESFAFQKEEDIDREGAIARCMAYLRSIFPGIFDAGLNGSARGLRSPSRPPLPSSDSRSNSLIAQQARSEHRFGEPHARALARRMYFDDSRQEWEITHLFRPAWQLVGQCEGLRQSGDYLSIHLAGQPTLVVRNEHGDLRAFSNICTRRPHELIPGRSGSLDGAIRCTPHDLAYDYDGRPRHRNDSISLFSLQVGQRAGLIFVRVGDAAGEPTINAPSQCWDAVGSSASLQFREFSAAADWKVLIEQWLERHVSGQHFQFPNQLLQTEAHRSRILQVIPDGAGRSRIQSFDIGRRLAASDNPTQVDPRVMLSGGPQPDVEQSDESRHHWLHDQIKLAESTQRILMHLDERYVESGPVSEEIMHFRHATRSLR